MAQAKLAVSWDAYEKNVCKGLSFMQEQGEFVDMTLAADGHYVQVHRMVMSLISPYIKDLITSVECPHPVIFLNNISYSTLCSILEYIYTGEVMVQRDRLKDLIQAGKALHIKGLVDMALNISTDEKILEQNEETFIETQNMEPLEYSDTELQGPPDTNEDDSNGDTKKEIMVEKVDTSVILENVPEKPLVKRRHQMAGAAKVQYTISNQGGLQLVLNRYVYNMRYMCKNSNRRRWRCINYPRKIRCPAYVMTENDRVVERGCSHNHVFHDKLIMKKYRAGYTFCAVADAELQMEIKKRIRATSVDKTKSG